MCHLVHQQSLSISFIFRASWMGSSETRVERCCHCASFKRLWIWICQTNGQKINMIGPSTTSSTCYPPRWITMHRTHTNFKQHQHYSAHFSTTFHLPISWHNTHITSLSLFTVVNVWNEDTIGRDECNNRLKKWCFLVAITLCIPFWMVLRILTIRYRYDSDMIFDCIQNQFGFK